jgi:Na+-transporting methylmalonyl-CoA/oxaloacetate decarboxylase gamma subunit
MAPMATNWIEAVSLAGRSFGTVFLVLIILAVVTWLVGLVFQRTKRSQEKARPAAEEEETQEMS